MIDRFLEWSLYPLLRRTEFRGKRRLCRLLPAPHAGSRIAQFGGRIRLRLDLREPLQRDYYVGLYDHVELAVLRRLLRQGDDVVDVGAHVGLYTIAAARRVAPNGRVLAIEAHRCTRQQLEANVALNGCENVIVVGAAASGKAGSAHLAVPRSGGDPAWSTLARHRLASSELVQVRAVTVDDEVRRHRLRPSVVKIDVEGHELAVLDGMRETIASHRPAILCELIRPAAAALREHFLSLDYRGLEVSSGRLAPLPESVVAANVLFLAREHRLADSMTRRVDRR